MSSGCRPFLHNGFCVESFLTQDTCSHSHALPHSWSGCQCRRHAQRVNFQNRLWDGVTPAQFLAEQQEQQEGVPSSSGSSSSSSSSSRSSSSRSLHSRSGFVTEDDDEDSESMYGSCSESDEGSSSGSEDETEILNMHALVEGLLAERKALLAVIDIGDSASNSSSSSSSDANSIESSSPNSNSARDPGGGGGGGTTPTFVCKPKPARFHRTISVESLASEKQDFLSLRDSLQDELNQTGSVFATDGQIDTSLLSTAVTDASDRGVTRKRDDDDETLVCDSRKRRKASATFEFGDGI